MKICNKCNLQKTLDCFSKDKNRKDGHSYTCKSCVSALVRATYFARIARYKAEVKTCNLKVCSLCKIEKHANEFYKDKHTKEGVVSWCKSCTYIKNSTNLRRKERYTKYRKEHKARYARNRKQRYKTDLLFRLRCVLGSRLSEAVRKKFKKGKTIELLGCPIINFIQYIETKFIDNMSWNNYGKGGWELDHIKPLCSFDLSSIDEQKKAMHFTNFQPLWVKDNQRKGGRI